MSGKEVEIIGSNTASAISYAQNIENGMKDSLNEAKNLKAYVTCANWNGKTRDAFLSYLDLIIQYNSEMVEAFEGHTKALKELDNWRAVVLRVRVKKLLDLFQVPLERLQEVVLQN
ncbi:hypothetical protein B5P41_15220 [Bacillus sp. SRB_28]|nr:hypothetical protein B5P41_15220 [Bacillus sp. SRB_28]